MALLTTLTDANKVLMEYNPYAPEYATNDGTDQVRYRTTIVYEFRGLDETTAVAKAYEISHAPPSLGLHGIAVRNGASPVFTLKMVQDITTAWQDV